MSTTDAGQTGRVPVVIYRDHLLRFFAIYYAGTSIVTFVLQTSSTHAVLEHLGLGATASTPSVALLLGSIGGLFAPGLGSYCSLEHHFGAQERPARRRLLA